MTSKSQSELEQPAKVYQLQAIETLLTNQATTLSEQASTLKTIQEQTSGLVSSAQLEHVEKQMKEYTDESVEDAKKEIRLEFGPYKKGAIWFASIVAALMITQLISNLYKG